MSELAQITKLVQKAEVAGSKASGADSDATFSEKCLESLDQLKRVNVTAQVWPAAISTS